jgi:class 3 adenylate cyclase
MNQSKARMLASSAFAPKAFFNAFGGRQEASVTFAGAALFVDMSDYTSFAETLCRQGSDGREQLSDILNQIFARQVDCIHRSAGEIASFMGDGVLAFWPMGQSPIEDALARAEQCASELHLAQQELAASFASCPKLHVGVATGELWAARLGGVDRIWHRILAGQAVREAFRAGNQAKPGETLVSRCEPGADSLDRTRSGLEEAQTAFVGDETDRQPTDDDDLVPRMVRDWWADDKRRWLPQLRMISAIFIKIDKLAKEHDGILADYQRATTALQRAIRPYSASPGNLIIDDKGLVFKLYFGMPYNSHRNNSNQALQAALAVRSALNDIGLSTSIGLADGEGVCMPIGGRARLEYTAIGRFSHLAARLMAQPGDEILCTPDVAAKADGPLQLSKRPPVLLKGVTEPLAIFSVQPARPTPAARAPLIGREMETALIGDCLDRLRSGQGGILYVTGDAGIGKTALIDHIVDVSASRNLTTLVGGSTMSEVVLPFHSWRSVFSQLLDVSIHAESSDARTARATSKLRGLPMEEQRLLPLVNAVLPDLTDATSDVDKLSGEARVDATLSFLTRLIRYLAPPGFILILEDCHWMDSASWRLLERLTKTTQDMLILLTSRPRPSDPSLDAISAHPLFEHVSLQPLSQTAIKEIIRRAAPLQGSTEDDQKWLGRAADFASGNPLFAKEFAYLMAATPSSVHADHATAVTSGGGSGDGLAWKTWPTTLQGLIASRLDSLRPPELLMLKAASVIGSQFDLNLLDRVMPEQPQSRPAMQDLANLLSHHLVLVIDRAASLYRFQHDLIREVVYGQLTRDQRQLLHNRAATAIEDVHGDNLVAQFATLADHWSKADEGSKTLKFAELATEQAIRSGGYSEAQRLLGLCFDHADGRERHLIPTARRLRWYRLSADTYFGLGNLAERSKRADAALRIAGSKRARSRPRLITGALCDLASWGGRRLFGGLGTQPTLGRSELSQELARIYRHHAAIAWFSSDPMAMTAHSIAALRHAEKGPASDVLAGASVEFGGILGLLGLRQPGRSLMRRALAIAEQVDDRSVLAYVRLLICLYEVGVGNWPVADEHALICERLAEEAGDRVNWANVQAVRFWSPYYQNDLKMAETIARRFRARLEVDGNDQHHSWACRFTALAALRQRRPEIARDYLERAQAYLAGSTAANDRLPVIGLLALARYRSGDRTGALETALEGLSLIEDVGRPTGHAMLEGYASLTEVSFHALLNEPESAIWRSAFAQCLGGLDRFQRAFPIGRPRYRIWRGLDLALQGRTSASRRQFRHAETLAQRLGMAWERDLATMALAVGPTQFLRDRQDQES